MTITLDSRLAVAVDLNAAKLHLKKDESDEDALISLMVAAATDMAQQHTGRSIDQCQWSLRLDAFPERAICLPFPPLVTVDSITYLDADGVSQTLPLELVRIDRYGAPARVMPPETGWPATAGVPNAVTVQFVAGYGASCPDAIKQWILLHAGTWFENRASVRVGGQMQMLPYSDGLLDTYRLWNV